MADPSKTEQPTQRRLDKARREGNFPVSREAAAAVHLGVAALLILAEGGEWIARLEAMVRQWIEWSFRAHWEKQLLMNWLRSAASACFSTFGGAAALLAAAGAGVHLAMTGFALAGSKIAPDLSRLNPGPRLGQMASQALTQFGQALILLPLTGYAAWRLVSEESVRLMALPLAAPGPALAASAESLRRLILNSLFLVVAWGVIDLWRQRDRWASRLRMSKQEVREEAKESDGNPHVKARLRSMRRSLLRGRMMNEVDRATAVVVNPTHYAVALRYLPASMTAPRVVAKGKNYLALRIRERAARNQVPVVENPPLARALYQSVETGQEIPAHLYRAVAEVLAYIFRILRGGAPGLANG